MAQDALDERFVHASARRLSAAGVEGAAGARLHEIVEQRIAGARVARDEVAVVAVGHVSNAPEVEHCDRPWPVETLRQRAVKYRYQGRALSARGDVSGAEVEGDRDAETARERAAVADLDRQTALRPVQNGLTVEADDLDRRQRQAVVREVVLECVAVRACNQRLGLGQNAGPLVAIAHVHRVGQRLAQQRSLGFRVGAITGRPERGDTFAVGLDHRNVDPVERCTAHQANGLHRRHAVPRLNMIPDLLHQRPMSTYKSDFLRTLAERGFMHQVSEPDALDALAHSSRITAYIGFDCTAPSLHVGSLLPIMMLYWMQQTGHRPIALMGGGTTRVGDPSGKDESRRILTDEAINQNLAGIRAIFAKFLKFGDGPSDAIMANNADWLNGLNYIDFLRDVGRHFSVNRMLAFDSVKLRLERQHELSFLEFNYMILQAYDFVELQQAHRLRAADGRLGPVGQHRQRHRARPPHAQRAAVRADLAADHHVFRRQDGQDRGRRGLAQSPTW